MGGSFGWTLFRVYTITRIPSINSQGLMWPPLSSSYLNDFIFIHSISGKGKKVALHVQSAEATSKLRRNQCMKMDVARNC